MKKILLCLGIIVLLTGCGNDEMLTCTRETTYNGLTSGTEYKITYNGDNVKHVTITYNYNQDTHTDGVDTGTDGTTSDDDATNADDGIVDGVVGEAVDDIIGGVYNTILDLSGLKNIHNNQMNTINVTGFTSTVEENTNTSYKVVYDIDLTAMSDNDISRFNVNRNYTTLVNNYETQGLTCR